MMTGGSRLVHLLGIVAGFCLLSALAVGAGVGAGIDSPTNTDSDSGIDSGVEAALADDSLGGTSPLVGGALAQEEVDADRVSIRISVAMDGDATWTIRYFVRLDTDEREQAFADLEQDVEENASAYESRFGDRMERTAQTASDATGRPMAVEDVSVDTDRQELPEYGILVYEFRWTGFAVAEENRLEIGDAIAGYFLEEGYRLTIAWPGEYELQSVDPGPDSTDDREVAWTGPRDFGTDQPRLTVSAPSEYPIAGLGIAGLIAAGVIALLLYRRRDRVRDAFGESESGSGETPTTGTDTGSESATAASATATESAGSTGSSDPPEELLSNEERVLRLIREHGGRMKQQDVVSELGWTEARTSQVVTELREQGDLESFRLGRENVLRIPEVDDEEIP